MGSYGMTHARKPLLLFSVIRKVVQCLLVNVIQIEWSFCSKSLPAFRMCLLKAAVVSNSQEGNLQSIGVEEELVKHDNWVMHWGCCVLQKCVKLQSLLNDEGEIYKLTKLNYICEDVVHKTWHISHRLLQKLAATDSTCTARFSEKSMSKMRSYPALILRLQQCTGLLTSVVHSLGASRSLEPWPTVWVWTVWSVVLFSQDNSSLPSERIREMTRRSRGQNASPQSYGHGWRRNTWKKLFDTFDMQLHRSLFEGDLGYKS